MALKDWKKIKSIAFEIYYKNIKNNNYVAIEYLETISRRLPIWHLSTNNIDKNFKTKSKALKFAKAYMRKH